MAGEKIMEALELADAELAALKEYEEMSRLHPADPAILQPPPPNPILAAYGLSPEAYVLRVVERVQSTALHDALLVLPFSKVVSLMYYLNAWAERVSP
jgi:U3 small nucleolar RNA-associated protein 12